MTYIFKTHNISTSTVRVRNISISFSRPQKFAEIFHKDVHSKH